MILLCGVSNLCSKRGYNDQMCSKMRHMCNIQRVLHDNSNIRYIHIYKMWSFSKPEMSTKCYMFVWKLWYTHLKFYITFTNQSYISKVMAHNVQFSISSFCNQVCCTAAPNSWENMKIIITNIKYWSLRALLFSY